MNLQICLEIEIKKGAEFSTLIGSPKLSHELLAKAHLIARTDTTKLFAINHSAVNLQWRQKTVLPAISKMHSTNP